jgi:transcription termination factor Rho
MQSTTALAQGVLERHPRGYGFLRNVAKNLVAKQDDTYVPGQFIDKLKLANGMFLSGSLEPPSRGNGPRLATIEQIDGIDAKEFKRRQWDELTATDPAQTIRLETDAEILTTRVMDLFTPIGKGQRGLIVAPPRSGKTVLLSHIASAVSRNHPEMYLIILLVDERPEEVTEMKKLVRGFCDASGTPDKYQLVASSSDMDTQSHLRLAELCIERAKRLAEEGKDAFVLLDSLTRLARAYNKHSGSGRTMSGGVDSRAMDVPKRLFGSARAFEEGGTLTILGTALIETGSRMDDVIFQEFKGTGNMELVLDRKLAEKRIYPAIDLSQSGTRKEERLIVPERLERINLLRRSLLQMRPNEAMEAAIKQLSKSKSNDEFLEIVGKFAK